MFKFYLLYGKIVHIFQGWLQDEKVKAEIQVCCKEEDGFTGYSFFILTVLFTNY